MMNSKRNQTIAIARFLMYKHNLNQQLEGMTDEEYLADPIEELYLSGGRLEDIRNYSFTIPDAVVSVLIRILLMIVSALTGSESTLYIKRLTWSIVNL